MAREQVTEIVAEMVANVMHVAVAAGDAVEAGDTVVLLESMKMEIRCSSRRPAPSARSRSPRRRRPGGRRAGGDRCLTPLATTYAQRGAGFEPAADILPATAFKAVPIGHSGTPPCPVPRPGARDE